VARDLDDALLAVVAERDENTCRKQLDPVEAVNLAERLSEFERKAAKARMEAAASKGGRTAGRGRPKKDSPSVQNAGANRGRRSDEAIAAAVGDYSATALRKAAAVVNAANEDPSLAPVSSAEL